MTLPQEVLPGTTYLITARCSERRFFLTPGDQANQLLRYSLAVSANRYGISVHGFMFMSNHVHLVLTDVNAKLPDFMRDFSSKTARSMNVHLKRNESLWGPEGYNRVKLVGEETIVQKMAYTIANPVASDLVRRHEDWSGAMSRLQDLGQLAYHVQRPTTFFREDGPLPEKAMLRLSLPPDLDSRDTFIGRVAKWVRRLEEEAADRRARTGKGVLGVRRLSRQDPFDSPRTEEPMRRIRPTVACLDKQARAEALEQLRLFRHAYREAWRLWRDGCREALFPAGTWAMRIRFGAACAASG